MMHIKKLNGWLYISAPFAFVLLVMALVSAADNVSLVASHNSATVINSEFGTLRQFAVLSRSGVYNSGLTTLVGEVGTYPVKKEVGFSDEAGSVIVLKGFNHQGDDMSLQAHRDINALSDVLKLESPLTTISTDLGETLAPGAYISNSGIFKLKDTLVLDANNDPDAIFVFKMSRDLQTQPSSAIVLKNGAKACNVFWYVENEASLGAGSTFVGNLIVLKDVVLEKDARVRGSVFSRKGKVTLNSNTVTRALCAEE
jgi:hypothetical protein